MNRYIRESHLWRMWRNCVDQSYKVLKISSKSFEHNVRTLTRSPFVYRNKLSTVDQPEICSRYLLCFGRHWVSCRSTSSSVSGDSVGPDKTSQSPDIVKNLADSLDVKTAAPPSEQASTKNKVNEIVVKVQLTGKARKKTDFTQIYTANIYIPLFRAMNEYLLNSSELDSLSKYLRRSPYPERDNITVFKRRDVELRAIEKWGSLENIQLQKERMEEQRKETHAKLFPSRELQDAEDKQEKPANANSPSPGGGTTKTGMMHHGSGRVVLYAIAINAANSIMKFVAWLYTGSHSMFSEFIHSLADTVNQLILAAGIRQSLKKADTEHPYGWVSFRNVSSLISGVGIFCVGAGLSFYHGIVGLIDPSAHVTSLYWALATLGGSFLSEGVNTWMGDHWKDQAVDPFDTLVCAGGLYVFGRLEATLIVAINEVRQSCRAENMSFLQYVYRGRDPSTNVVLLEDFGAVIGLGIAATCISITHYTGNPMADAVGSLLIGSLLGGIASFIIYTNTQALVGRSIPLEKKLQMMRDLESDRMIRTIHDVKATDVGGRYVRFKAEVDFDGREITRFYLEQQDLEKMLQEMQSMTLVEDVEAFMLKHGECVVDILGGEVDRIEKNLKKRHPEIRHCDLEQL